REQNQALLAEISGELVLLEDIAEMMRRLGEKIGRYFGGKPCVFAEPEDFENSLVASGWNPHGAPSRKGSYSIRDFLSEEQLAANLAGKLTVVNDAQADSRVSAESYGAPGIRSFVIVPLVHDREWRFMLSVIDDKPREWRDDEVD